MVLRDLEIAGFLFGVETINVYRRNTGFGKNFQKAIKFGNVSRTFFQFVKFLVSFYFADYSNNNINCYTLAKLHFI